MQLKGKFKKIIIQIIKFLLKVVCVFPVNGNRIIFLSYQGNGYNCNPKYISDYLNTQYPNTYDIIWALKKTKLHNCDVPAGIKKVQFKSLQYIYYTLTAKVRITNAEEWSVLPVRKEQILINTWHGTPYKKIGLDADLIKGRLSGIDYYSKTTCFISSCRAMSEVINTAFAYTGEILNVGMPRNDFLLNHTENMEIKKQICNKLGLGENDKYVLYAPTFREVENVKLEKLSGSLLLQAITAKFDGNWKVLARKHIGANFGKEENSFFSDLGEHIDVSTYPDMQELLFVSDILITDYSSSMWDFSLMEKPIFLYTPDLISYINKERGFYYPIDEWGISYAIDNESLINLIANFDETEYKEAIKRHHKMFGSYERGNSIKQVVEYMISKMKNELGGQAHE